MHRFYRKGTQGRVGASWMTKEARLDDIEDNHKYLDKLAEHLLKGKSYKQRIYSVFHKVVQRPLDGINAEVIMPIILFYGPVFFQKMFLLTKKSQECSIQTTTLWLENQILILKVNLTRYNPSSRNKIFKRLLKSLMVTMILTHKHCLKLPMSANKQLKKSNNVLLI